MTGDTSYIQNDLIGYADVERLDTAELRSRADAMEVALPSTAIVEAHYSGAYQGTMALVIRCGGYLWLHIDHYGSCSVCDPFLADSLGWTKKMLREAYCFESTDDAREYLLTTDDWSWTTREDLRDWTLSIVESFNVQRYLGEHPDHEP